MVLMFIGGDMGTTRKYLAISTGASQVSLDDDMPIAPVNINCLDPLGRSALSIGDSFSLSFVLKFDIHICVFFVII